MPQEPRGWGACAPPTFLEIAVVTLENNAAQKKFLCHAPPFQIKFPSYGSDVHTDHSGTGTNDDLLHNTLKDSLSNIDTSITTQDELEERAVTLSEKLLKAVDTSTPKVYSRNDPKSPISQAILDLIKEKRRLRRLYNNTQDPNIKSTINKLQKEIRTKINQESTISWEEFCNSISLESDPKKSWRKITNFLKPKGSHSYPTLKLGDKTAKTNPEKAQLFAESVEIKRRAQP